MLKNLLFTTVIILFFAITTQTAQAQDLEWAVSMGSTGSDAGRAVVADDSGNVFTVGFFEGTVDFDPGAGSTLLTSAGGTDVFITKKNGSGDLVWARHIGGTGNEYGYTIALDGQGNIYTAGRFDGTADMDPGTGTASYTSNGGPDMFVLKLDPAGNFLWASTMGGTATDQINSIDVDAAGNVYASGVFNGTADFDPSPATHILTSAGGEDIFALKLTPIGTLVWAHRVGDTGNDRSYAMAKDGAQNIYLTGVFSGTVDFDPGAGTANLTSAGQFDAYVLKLDSSGTYLWARNMGGTSFDFGFGITTDNMGHVYTTGYFQGTGDYDPGTGVYDLTSAGNYDIFLQKMDTSGNFLWASSMGGTADDRGYEVATDDLGGVYVTGYFIGTVDFDPDTSSHIVTSAGMADHYIYKSDSSGNMLWTATMGGADHDFGLGMAVDKWRNIYTTGNFNGTGDYDPSAGVLTLTTAGSFDIFLMKMGQCLVTTSLTVQACDSYTGPGGTIYTTTGIYSDTTMTGGSCDSVVIIDLTLNESFTANTSEEICHGESIFVGGALQTTGGTYIDTFSTVGGCDSIIVTALTVNQPDTSVVQGGVSTLIANQFGATYRWLDCDNAYQAIPGELSQSFTAATAGNYALEITMLGCTDTSSCYFVNPIGIEEAEQGLQITSYPNPASGYIFLEMEKRYNEITVELISADGKVLITRDISGERQARLDITTLPAGIYFLRIETEDGRAMRKFVKVED